MAACSRIPEGQSTPVEYDHSIDTKQEERNSDMPSYLVYIGTYTFSNREPKSEGVYIYRMDAESGHLTFAGTAKAGENPAFLAIHPNGRYLYAANELMEFQGTEGGGVSALAINPSDGSLSLINQQPSHGGATCHISLDRTGKYALVANYMGGNATMLPILEDGSLAPATSIVQHSGTGPNPQRQEQPHTHSVFIDHENRHALVSDLGIDKVMVYQLDLANGKLQPNQPPFAQVTGGSGPRHLDFHPSGRFVYLINEMGNTITAFRYDGEKGELHEIQTVDTLPSDFSGESTCADIHVDPAGKFVYGSNRGHDSLVIFAIDPSTGKLSYVGHESTRGKTPRNFGIEPNGNFLLAANQDSHTVITYRIDKQSGKLGYLSTTEVPMPVCIKFLRKAS